ncbi:MAG: hypothetical protein ABFS32_10750 [Bacteroidota bacterium]
MVREPTFAGYAKDKDELDILYWAYKKTPRQRLEEAWRLHCANQNIDPFEERLDKTKSRAFKRQ